MGDTPETVADELASATHVLSVDSPVHAPGTARILGDQTKASYSAVMIAICERHDDPADLPANLDRDGCCGNCVFVKTYDRDLARQLVALINAREPLAALLESWDGVELREDGPLPDDFVYALRIARALNGTGR